MDKPGNRWKSPVLARRFWGIEGPQVYLERMAGYFWCTIPRLFHRSAQEGVEIVIRGFFPSTEVENTIIHRSKAGIGLLTVCGML